MEPSDLSGDLYDIHFVDISNGVTVGAGGAVRKTTDSGNTWSAIDCDGTTEVLMGVYLFSDASGIIVGTGGVIKAYTGTGCSAQTSNVFTDLTDVHCVSSDACWVVGKSSIILATDNGGDTWSEQTPPSSAFSNLAAVFMSSTTVGYTVGSGGEVWKYGGSGSWSQVTTSPGSKDLNGVFFDPSGAIGYVVGNDQLLQKTEEGGESWSSVFEGDPAIPYNLLDITCSTVNKCYVVTSNQGGWGNRFVLRTNDGGSNWEAYMEWEGSWNAVSIYIE